MLAGEEARMEEGQVVLWGRVFIYIYPKQVVIVAFSVQQKDKSAPTPQS